jgi:hypothetical protein
MVLYGGTVSVQNALGWELVKLNCVQFCTVVLTGNATGGGGAGGLGGRGGARVTKLYASAPAQNTLVSTPWA